VLLMAVERIELFAKALLEGGRPAQTPVLVVQHGSTPAERVVHATLADVPERVRAEGIRPPAIIVIGPVAGFDALSRL
jgi:uroporphyrin-III C-methyltransferase/precorrin-2 dehydrogenase/sirohydrochlorin ferrochelatase